MRGINKVYSLIRRKKYAWRFKGADPEARIIIALCKITILNMKTYFPVTGQEPTYNGYLCIYYPVLQSNISWQKTISYAFMFLKIRISCYCLKMKELDIFS